MSEVRSVSMRQGLKKPRAPGAGRKPLPRKLGEPPRDPAYKKIENIPDPPPLLNESVAPPAWLGEHGKKEWKRLLPLVVRARVMSEADLTPLAVACHAYHFLRETTRLMGEEKGRMLEARLVASVQRYWKTYLDFLREFGLTPASRSRVAVLGPQGEQEQKDNASAEAKQRAFLAQL